MYRRGGCTRAGASTFPDRWRWTPRECRTTQVGAPTGRLKSPRADDRLPSRGARAMHRCPALHSQAQEDYQCTGIVLTS
jgi:hypothetical protein